ncbi:MAG: purine-nucleoside phosphorylase, partial [Oscillospiraceae bacterium]
MDNNSYIKAAEYIKSKIDIKPTVGIILGSGIGDVAENVENPCIIPYSEIQDFPISTVKNHLGRFVIGKIANKDVIVMQGRVHFYEGYNMAELAIPIQTLKAVGVETLIVTNTSGGINESYNAGEIVIINDHIKFDLDSPLRGENHSELGDRFFDMTQAYSPKLRKIAKCCGEKIGLDLKEGVYAYTGGPQFETPAEIRMLRMLGGDLVGMSSVPEVITAVHCGIEVLGLSCI